MNKTIFLQRHKKAGEPFIERLCFFTETFPDHKTYFINGTSAIDTIPDITSKMVQLNVAVFWALEKYLCNPVVQPSVRNEDFNVFLFVKGIVIQWILFWYIIQIIFIFFHIFHFHIFYFQFFYFQFFYLRFFMVIVLYIILPISGSKYTELVIN